MAPDMAEASGGNGGSGGGGSGGNGGGGSAGTGTGGNGNGNNGGGGDSGCFDRRRQHRRQLGLRRAWSSSASRSVVVARNPDHLLR